MHGERLAWRRRRARPRLPLHDRSGRVAHWSGSYLIFQAPPSYLVCGAAGANAQIGNIAIRWVNGVCSFTGLLSDAAAAIMRFDE